jgi:CBS domain containing-hemolysin-like protein
MVWLYSRCADLMLRLLGLPTQRDERITPDDILALAEAGTQAGVLDRPSSR